MKQYQFTLQEQEIMKSLWPEQHPITPAQLRAGFREAARMIAECKESFSCLAVVDAFRPLVRWETTLVADAYAALLCPTKRVKAIQDKMYRLFEPPNEVSVTDFVGLKDHTHPAACNHRVIALLMAGVVLADQLEREGTL